MSLLVFLVTVKYAYKANFFYDTRCNDASSSYSSSLWNKIWSAPMLPRVKIFAWRVCHQALPTHKNLNHRVPSIADVCGVCDCAVEDEMHTLLGCKLASSIWDESIFFSCYSEALCLNWRLVGVRIVGGRGG